MGRAVALAFAREGAAAVYINHSSSEAAAAGVVEELRVLGCEARAVQADVSDARAVAAMVDEVAQTSGRLDVLVNNAGLLLREPFESLTEKTWDRVMNVNLKGPFLCTQAALRLLRKSSSAAVVNVASGGAGMRGQAPALAHYYTSKGGVITLTKCLAGELAPHIRVNCIAPGFVHTGFGGGQAGIAERVAAATPLGRVAESDDVARVVVFLASDESAFMTGQVLVVDGGRLM